MAGDRSVISVQQVIPSPVYPLIGFALVALVLNGFAAWHCGIAITRRMREMQDELNEIRDQLR